MSVTLNINGKQQTLAIEPRVTLLDTLRERLGLTGSKKGCDHGQCGACTVLVDGQRVYPVWRWQSCRRASRLSPLKDWQGDVLHPVQAAFIENDGFQCGYCTPGQICASVALLDEVAVPAPSQRISPIFPTDESSEAEIKERLR